MTACSCFFQRSTSQRGGLFRVSRAHTGHANDRFGVGRSESRLWNVATCLKRARHVHRVPKPITTGVAWRLRALDVDEEDNAVAAADLGANQVRATTSRPRRPPDWISGRRSARFPADKRRRRRPRRRREQRHGRWRSVMDLFHRQCIRIVVSHPPGVFQNGC